MPTGCQNGTEIDAQSQQQSMPKQAAKKMMEIIKTHVCLMCKNLNKLFKTMVFEGLSGCVRKQKRYQTTIQNYTQINLKIDLTSMQNQCAKQ